MANTPSTFEISRVRNIKRYGRSMTLRRLASVNPNVYHDVTVLGFQQLYKPEQLAGDIRMGDSQISITNREIIAATWDGPPRVKDVIVIDGRTLAIQGNQALYDGTVCVGHTMWVRG